MENQYSLMEDSLTESRGQKRPEMSDELPLDKRACNALVVGPSSSSMTPETLVTSTSAVSEAQEADMETSSSASPSGRSDDEERDSPYNSDDESNDMNDVNVNHQLSSLREYQRNRSSRDSEKFNGLLSSLSSESDSSVQLAALTELCELLSFSVEESISSTLANQLAPLLVNLAKHESNPNIMLLAIRAITYLCDVSRRSSTYLVSHDAVPALCQRLMIIEYLDVAEQCLQALEKISRDQPQPCLESGAIMAVLGFIDFFSTSVQRTALRTVVNICKKLPSTCPSPVTEAVPLLCNLLQYEDQQLVELVATCVVKIVDSAKGSPEMLIELYNHGLLNQVTHLMNMNNRITLSQPTYNGLVGVITKIASGSADAVRTLFNLGIGSILKDALSNADLSHGTLSRALDKNCNQVQEILKLLHELLPEVSRGKDVLSSKEKLLLDQSDIFQNFAMDTFPTLLEMVNSGANINVCYGCLSVISRLVYFSTSESLVELLKERNIASFLVGVFTRNDHHVLSLALQIAEIVLEKIPDTVKQTFVKEGVLFAIDAFLTPQSSSQLTSPMLDCIQSNKKTVKGTVRCLCYDYSPSCPLSTSKSKVCRLDQESVHDIAKRVKAKYFTVELCSSQGMVTDVLQDLRYASAAITDLLSISASCGVSADIEEKLCHIVQIVIRQLTGNEPISTFELIESGIVKALLSYLSNGQYLKGNNISDGNVKHTSDVQKRFEAFARVAYSSPTTSEDLPISLFVRKLQNALSTMENYPAVVGCTIMQRGSHATVPSRRQTTYPCFRVHFVRGEEELSLNDFVTETVTVDPFCKVEEIVQHLISKVCPKKVVSEGNSQATLDSKNVSIENPDNPASISGKIVASMGSESQHDPAAVSSKSMESMGSDSQRSPSHDMQELEEGDGKSHCSPMDTSNSKQTIVDGSKVMSEAQFESSEDGIHSPAANANLTGTGSAGHSGDEENCRDQCQASSSIEDPPSNLVLYLDGEPLENSSTLYQQILQRRMKSQDELPNFLKLWSTTHTITFKRLEPTDAGNGKGQDKLHDDGVANQAILVQQIMPVFFNIYVQGLGSAVDPSSPVSDILHLLRSLETMNSYANQLLSSERLGAFGVGKMDDLDSLKVAVPTVSQYEFVNNRLSEKLQQQMRDSSAIHIGAMPLWCSHLMLSCPFLFSFEARSKYFQLAAFGRLQVLPNSSQSNPNVPRERRSSVGSVLRKKFVASRDQVLESAMQMMELYAEKNIVVEVEYNDEVGTGLGPTLEFYTLVSHDLQKAGLGMWRGDYMSSTKSYSQHGISSGLFPRPWSPKSSNVNGIEFADVLKRFVLLGQIVGKALRDGRVLDVSFSNAFYKLVLGKELSIYDIQTFDPDLGRTLLEFKALINRRKFLEVGGMKEAAHGVCLGFRDSNIEDLCLDFTLPGYPDYILSSGVDDHLKVTSNNLAEYVSMVLDATLYSGISRQVEAFKSGLNQVFAHEHLHVFTEEELEHLLCGEHDSWVSYDLFDHIKFDHGYTASSPPIIHLLDVINEFDYEQRRAFLQFVTGAPRLPPGGLAALNPKLTIVRKHSSNAVDEDLPSVMTCANYLKLPPYSSKEIMKEKLLYAITEGQGSFHLS